MHLKKSCFKALVGRKIRGRTCSQRRTITMCVCVCQPEWKNSNGLWNNIKLAKTIFLDYLTLFISVKNEGCVHACSEKKVLWKNFQCLIFFNPTSNPNVEKIGRYQNNSLPQKNTKVNEKTSAHTVLILAGDFSQ